MSDYNYPDDVTQASFDRYWDEKLDDERNEEEILEYWLERSEWLKENIND